MTRLNILISGAGIAGNALAFWLSKLGHQVTVIERFPRLRTNGLQLDLRGYGFEVMKRMGLENDLRNHAVPEQGMQIVDSSGRRRAYFQVNKSGNGPQSFTSDFEIMRGDLCRIMYDVTKDHAKYVFGVSIESVEEKGIFLEIRFVDGRIGQFDILVGADGQGSRTRKMMLGPDTTDTFHPLDEYVAYFTVPRPIKDGEAYMATSYIAPGGRFVLTRRSDPHTIQVYLTGNSVTGRLESVKRGDVREEKEAFVKAFRGAGWQVEKILDSLMEAEDFYCERQGLVKQSPWSKGRVVLVGDAAYSSSAGTGMGTSSAIVGAYVLAGEIGKHCGRGNNDRGGHDTKTSLMTAFQEYEEKFRPFIQQVQKGVDDPGIFDKIPWTRFTIAILHGLLWLASCLGLDPFGGDMLGQKLKEWELPEYEQMLRDS
jgi:2-polyprenyl-6-methoxyphenol hydroxylase-like FAD-dependent oxidoreductase